MRTAIIFLSLSMFAAVATVDAGTPKKKIDIHDFDFFKHQSLITGYDLILLEERAEVTHLGSIVAENTFVMDLVRAKVKEVVVPRLTWDASIFKTLFKNYDKTKRYESCFCSPTYALAIRLYTDKFESVGDPFSPGPGKMELRKQIVATLLLDDGHDSITVSDMVNGVRYFRLSAGHSAKGNIARYLEYLASKEGLKYTFRKGISNKRVDGTGKARPGSPSSPSP